MFNRGIGAGYSVGDCFHVYQLLAIITAMHSSDKISKKASIAINVALSLG